jgi:hypothetical protein
MEIIKNQLPVIIRYLLVTAFAALATRGLVSPEQSTILSQNLDGLVGAIGVLLTLGYAMFKRPSAKALEVAKEVDKKIPATQDVVIQTPAGKPDIVVQAK